MDSLDLLARQPSWRMSDLAEALRIDPSTATRAVQRLVGSGLAVRWPHDDDGRVVMVEITDAGRLRHADVNARRGQLMTHMLGAFAPEERPVLADMLERFVSAVDEFVGALAEVPEPRQLPRADRRPDASDRWQRDSCRGIGSPRGRPGRVHRAGDAIRAAAVQRGAAHDPQPVRRRRPRAGDVPARLPQLRRIRGRHQPARLAVPHHDQHVHQHLPRQAAPADRDRARRRRGPVPVPPDRQPRRARAAAPRTRCSTCSPTTRSRRRSRSCPSVPAARAARRRRGVLLQGDRRDARHPDRYRDVAAPSGKKSDAEEVERLCRAARPHRGRSTTNT